MENHFTNHHREIGEICNYTPLSLVRDSQPQIKPSSCSHGSPRTCDCKDNAISEDLPNHLEMDCLGGAIKECDNDKKGVIGVRNDCDITSSRSPVVLQLWDRLQGVRPAVTALGSPVILNTGLCSTTTSKAHIDSLGENQVSGIKESEQPLGRQLDSDAVDETETELTVKTKTLDSRPIYPNVPYSPYSSPFSRSRSNRLRESKRISIDQNDSFLQLNQYKLMDQIGQGSYGLVKLAYSEEDSTHYAMKILSKKRLLRQAGLTKRGPKKITSALDRVYREIAVLKKLDHPNVVKLIEVLDDPLEDSLYMVFELVRQGEVLSIPTKSPLKEKRALSIFRDTLLGLEYLHYQKIIHADIKPENLLLTDGGRVKIADLGVCNEFIGEDSTMTNGTTGGTPAFRAPETLSLGQNIFCGKAADIWALGITLYALVYGNLPFVASSVPVLYDKIKTNSVCFPDIFAVSAELKNCIERMLIKNPQRRATLPELKVHSWVTTHNAHPLPSEEENCRLVEVDEDDIKSVVRSIPKLDTLILIKAMLKKHSFENPFPRVKPGHVPQI